MNEYNLRKENIYCYAAIQKYAKKKNNIKKYINGTKKPNENITKKQTYHIIINPQKFKYYHIWAVVYAKGST